MVRFARVRVVALIAPLVTLWLAVPSAFAVATAPRISDREIIEGLAELKAGQLVLQQRIDSLEQQLNSRINSLEQQLNSRINSLEQQLSNRINGLEQQFNERINGLQQRFDTLELMLGLFITVALSLFGVIGKILWNQQKRMLVIETSLETQKDELAFLKQLVESLLPSRRAV